VRSFATSAPAALALLLAGCGGQTPADAPQVTQEDRAAGAQEHPRLLAEFGGAYPGDEAGYLAGLGNRLASAAGLEGQCTFTLVNSDVVNAFAVPGCYIYVTRGLFAVVGSEAELASVLGHEIGHIVAEHSQRQQRRSVWRILGVIAVGLTGSEQLTRLAGQAAQYFSLRYSRGQEYEADDLGIRYLRLAGYDPYAAAQMLAALGRNEQFMARTGGRDEARSIPEWARSHPLTEHRIGRANETARQTGLADNALPENGEAYLREVDGLLYGDDPAQGFVLGRRFAHPIMRIGFEAPAGFSLTNSPQAIGLSGPDGLRGEFGGAAMPAGGLEAYTQALARQIIGETPADVTSSGPTRINGVRAYLAVMTVAGRNGPVPVAIATYDGGDGQAYHFVIISAPSDANARAVQQLFGSFHRLSNQEIARLRPRVVRTVAVPAGATVESMARNVADPAPRELFVMLNGLSPGQALRPGQRVKLVTFLTR
jgi:predicted Zn-dependent protease